MQVLIEMMARKNNARGCCPSGNTKELFFTWADIWLWDCHVMQSCYTRIPLTCISPGPAAALQRGTPMRVVAAGEHRC